MREKFYKKKIWCPLLKKEIGDLLCEDVAFASEGALPNRFVPQEFYVVPNWQEICLACKKHPE